MKKYKSYLLALVVACSANLFAANEPQDISVQASTSQQSCVGPCEDYFYGGVAITNVAWHRTIVTGVEITDTYGERWVLPVGSVALRRGEAVRLPFQTLSTIAGVRVFTRNGLGRFVYRGLDAKD